MGTSEPWRRGKFHAHPWAVQIRVSTSGLSAGHLMTTMKYAIANSLASSQGLPKNEIFSSSPTVSNSIDAGSLGYGTGPSFG